MSNDRGESLSYDPLQGDERVISTNFQILKAAGLKMDIFVDSAEGAAMDLDTEEMEELINAAEQRLAQERAQNL